MKPGYPFLFSGKNKNAFVALALFLVISLVPSGSFAQINIGLTATATQSGGGVTIYSPANYNDNVIVAFGGCSGYGTCPTPWGWVSDGGYIDYTWSSAQTFNKVVWYHADRPMTSCTLQYWNGSAFVNFATYTTAICNADSITFTPVTTTILRFFNCTAPLINPNFREIQVWQSGGPAPTIAGATHYCTGDVVTLTASSVSPSPAFTWTGPGAFTATTATITFTASPATAGVYSCTVTSGGYTSAPRLDTIVVVPPPAITPGVIASVCQGSTFASLPYTAPVSTPTNYSIVYSPAAIAAGFVNVTSAALAGSPIILIVPPGAAGATYTGTLTVNNGICTGPGSPISLTINPRPSPIAGVTSICTGTNSALTDATGGGTWSSSNPAVATIGSASGIVTGVTVGSTIITYTNTSTGCFNTTTVNVLGISGPDHVCSGNTITLTATTTGGLWSSSDTVIATVGAVSGTVTGMAMGIVHITYTIGSGCTASWAVTVNPHAPIVGRDSVCVGSDRWLTNIVGGGLWSSTVSSVATILPDSGKVTGVLAGITTISYLLPTGCWSTAPFTVIAYPTAITGIMMVCPGTTTTLSDGVGGGTWTSGNPGVATIDLYTGVLTGIIADTADMIYTIEPGCPVTTRVTVNPLPQPISGISVMCPNTIDTMHDASPGGLWSSGSLPVMTIIDTNGIVTAISQGLTTIKYMLPTGCFQSRVVSVDPLPAPVIFYNYLLNTFFATPGYATYQWYDSLQGKIPGATSPSLAASNTEYYWVVVTDSNGCKGTSAYYHFNLNQVGVKPLVNSNDVRIYPNPAAATLFISSPVKVRAVISSIDGRKEIDEQDAQEINISGLANGVYFITVYGEDGVRITVQKLVKE